ncbi:MAG: SIMPL domain-containing protein, partial [Woeseiaceae bacterium]
MRRLVFCLLIAATMPSLAADVVQPDPALVSVTGEGTVAAAPDMVTVTVGVVTQADAAADALAANNSAMARLNDVLDGFEIADGDRRTSNFNVSPQYDRRSIDGRAPEISSYVVSNPLAIRYRVFERLGELL